MKDKYEHFEDGGRKWIRQHPSLKNVWVIQRTDTGEFLTAFNQRGPQLWWGVFGVRLADITATNTDVLEKTLSSLDIPFRKVRIVTYLEEPIANPSGG